MKKKLEQNQPVLGTWSVLSSALVVDAIASTGLDFILLDTEHGPSDYASLQLQVMAAESRGVAPLIRLGSWSNEDVQRALDIGAWGIQIPQVEHPNQAQQMADSMKFAPQGTRGFSPFVRANNYTGKGAQLYAQTAREELCLIAQIETVEGIKNIESICQIDGIDGIFLGAFDLSCALGKPGEVGSVEVQKMLEKLSAVALKSKKFVGTITTEVEDIARYQAMGMNYLVHLVDGEMIRKAYEPVLCAFHQKPTQSEPVASKPATSVDYSC